MHTIVKSFGNTITFNNNKSVTLPSEVKEIVECDGIFIVLIQANKAIENNLIAFNYSGEILWHVQSLAESLGGEYLFGFKFCEYSGVTIDSGILKAYNTCGFLCSVDIKTGKIMETVFTK